MLCKQARHAFIPIHTVHQDISPGQVWLKNAVIVVGMLMKIIPVIALAVFAKVKGSALKVRINGIVVIVFQKIFRLYILYVQVVHDFQHAGGYFPRTGDHNAERRQFDIVVHGLQPFRGADVVRGRQ